MGFLDHIYKVRPDKYRAVFTPAYPRAMTYKLRKIGSYRLTLSCGHVKRIKTSTKIPRRCRCSECPVDTSKVIKSVSE